VERPLLDETDRQIIAMLQQNARISNAEIGRSVGLTASSVYERVRKLEERGVIQGYTAIVDPAALGKPILAFVRVQSVPNVASFEQVVRDHPEIQECHELAGEDWYIVKLRVKDTAELRRMLVALRTAAGSTATITMIVLQTVKENQPVPTGATVLAPAT